MSSSTEYQPTTHQIFWCNKCDALEVDSQKPETGKFHLQWGHTFNKKTQSFDGDGEYTGVMFAICSDCGAKE